MKYLNKKNTGFIIRNGILYLIQIKVNKNGPVIKNFSKLALEEGVLDEDCIILNKESFKSSVQNLFLRAARGPVSEKEIFISLPEEKVFSHQVAVPREKIKDIEFIKNTADEFIPIELDSSVFDTQVSEVNQETGGMAKLECVAVQESIVKPLMDALSEMELEVTEIDINTNALIRVFYNQFSKSQGDFAILHMGPKQDSIAIVSASGNIRKNLLKLGPQIKRGTSRYANELELKFSQLINTAPFPVAIKKIYLIGDFFDFPACKSIILGIFPQVEVVNEIEFMNLPEGMESEFLQAIGLCLRGFESARGNHFNLITQDKKNELTDIKVAKKGKIYLFLMAFLLAAVLVLLSIKTARDYFDYQLGTREIVILNEQLNDPYVAEIAKIKQQSNQKEMQVSSIFKEILPLGPLMINLDAYHGQNIDLISIGYLGKNLNGEMQIQLRASSDSREATEAFVEALQTNELFSNVNSPLSNLITRGQRFINITITLDKEKVKALGAFKSQAYEN